MLQPALFLDRDGVIIEEIGYLSLPSQIVLLPGAAEAIARVNRQAMPVVVVTNQAGVARGYFPPDRIADIHARLDELLAVEGGHVDRYYFCPHHPSAGVGPYRTACDCRKPQPGMLRRAAAELNLDLCRSTMIGDKLSDIQAAVAAGCRPILVRTGYGAAHEPKLEQNGFSRTTVARDLAEAVERYVLNTD